MIARSQTCGGITVFGLAAPALDGRVVVSDVHLHEAVFEDCFCFKRA